MKTVGKRAEEWVCKFPLPCIDYSLQIKSIIIAVMKEQDKITRHACAENVSKIEFDATLDSDGLIKWNKAHLAIMNTKTI